METIENKFYNYILLDPRKPYKWLYKNESFEYLPFYVGKGTKDRAISHYRDSSKENTFKYNVIQVLKRGGYLPTYKIINLNSSEEYAYQEEISIIKYIKTYLKDAKLTNLTDGGDAPPVHFGKDNVNAVKVYLYDTATGDFIKEWESAADACRYLKISTEMSKHITLSCRKTRHTAAGYIWRFEKLDKVEPEINKKYSRITFSKLIAFNESEYHEFSSMKEAYDFLKEPNKGKINLVLKGKRNMYKGYYWDITK